MEALVVGASGDAALIAVELACATALKRAPISKKTGERLLQRVHLALAGDLEPEAQMAVAKAGGTGFLSVQTPLATAARRCALIVLCQSATVDAKTAREVAEAAPEGALLVYVGARAGPQCAAVEKAVEVDVAKTKRVGLLFAALTACVGPGLQRSSLGTLLLERAPRDGIDVRLPLMVLEAVGVTYRGRKYRDNWLFGAQLWRLYAAYAWLAADDSGTMHWQLLQSRHRRVLAKLLEEGLATLLAEDQLRTDASGSPLGMGFQMAITVLRFPTPMFVVAQALALFGSWPPRGSTCGTVWDAREAQARNGSVEAAARAAGLAAPANALVARKCREGKRGFTEQEFALCECRDLVSVPLALLALVAPAALLVVSANLLVRALWIAFPEWMEMDLFS